ncbi:SDR family NAD(P)-dependent oxidoreductase [Burkholderia ubonensis]|uniref:SDR family NAD(P)-dependent oxidoreductase n=1 Tax=Burkholderia ubonensis TaxID=101571 RepID=UPI00075AB9A9|nr:SDR family oxidoreductase [Burkholderia ubonensis]KVK99423.1 hypothetical protein WJ45_00725 [Burkholderia ubonensis]KVN77363.1 hypothetical protein WJ67_14500 [Burkholderia ubonensis]KVQ52288.1 hypothetical protein WK04_04975 [Burkholderia ubonensis]KVU49837.1 hypothetical protein WK68_30605 [Burkholderia ubonensis]
MFDLHGKICLVTGASGYLGAQICSALAAQGATVVACHFTHPEGLDAARADAAVATRIHSVRLDVTRADDVTATIGEILKSHGRIDVLVYAAGATLRKSALLTGQDDCDRLLDLNFKAVAQMCRGVLRPMFRQRSGRIVLIGSTAGERGLAGQGVYAASKAALHAYARSLAQEAGGHGITVNVVAPGALSSAGQSHYTEQDEARVKEQIGLCRLGNAREVAAAVVFLASDEASYVSGAVVPVDGAARF